MSLPTRAFDALLEAVDSDERIAFDGLILERTDEGYVLETPAGSHQGLSEGELHRALEDEGVEYATNWHFWERVVEGEGTARRAFLRWCEGAPLELDDSQAENAQTENAPNEDEHPVPERYDALEDGVVRHWGQLQITTRLGDGGLNDDGNDDGDNEFEAGERVYEIRHVEDADAPLEDLEHYDDFRDVREIVAHDENGRYRPLKTAPTLVSGWAFPGLSSGDLVAAVRSFYPATIANWHREQLDELDVDHWLEAAERQTGIYDVVDELPREAVEWLAEACCVDSQCLRRREWQYEADDELEIDGGDGPFPCREPCSLVIAAARKWAILESEEEKTWELELTTSEKNQLEELIDAVADGRVDEIREADVYDGANRYRARYLRAKRMSDSTLVDESKSTRHD